MYTGSMIDQASFFAVLFAAINLAAFFAMLIDKRRSRVAGAERLSEGMLFFMAAMFGSVGTYAGMLAFRHKTQKWHFVIGIPALIMQQLALFSLVYWYL